MTLAELCYYLSGFYPLWDQTFGGHLRGRFELPADTPLGQLSGGERRRASILLALATRAQVLIMDEPAANLDPMARRTLLEELAGVLDDREGTTVLFSTHILSDLERIADTIGILKKGAVNSSTTPTWWMILWREWLLNRKMLAALAFNRKSAGGMLPSRVLTAMLVLLVVGSVAVPLFLPEILAVWRANPESYYSPLMFRF